MTRRALMLTLVIVGPGRLAALADCPADSLICDSFDTYCAGGGRPAGAGDPADPACVSAASPDNALLQSIWFRTSANEVSGAPCGEEMVVDPSHLISDPSGQPGMDPDNDNADPTDWQVISSFPFAARCPGNGTQYLGQATLRDWASPHPLTLERFVRNAFGGQYSAIAATDSNPIVLSFFVSSKGGPLNLEGRIWYSDGYIELGYGDDGHMSRANTDYGWVADMSHGQPLCCSPTIKQGPWPVLCAVGQRDDPTVPLPSNCPSTTPPVHTAIAVGILANYDNNPCHCGTAHGGSLYHPVIFDGRQWWQLKSNNPRASSGTVTNLDGTPPVPFPVDVNQAGRFVLYGGQPANSSGKSLNWIKLTIKSTTFDVEMKSREYSPSQGKEFIVTSVMNGIPRVYQGAFDRLRAGIGPGCELASSASWETCVAPDNPCPSCVPNYPCWCRPEGRSCLRNGGEQSRWVDFDDLVLSGGVGDTRVGACCHTSGTCEEKLPEDCVAPGDIHAGPNTQCSSTICCGRDSFVWADADADGDVDADDFGRFQGCYTGPDGPMPSDIECECFDRDHDDHVDGADYLEFVRCTTGADVPWSSGLTNDCVP